MLYRDRANTGKRFGRHLPVRLWVGMAIIQLFWCQIWGLDPDKRVDSYLVDSWTIAEGLPSNTVLAMARTPDGYLWIATTQGLVRFDGIKFSVVLPTEEGEKAPLGIRDLFLDRQGTLWIGSAAGLTSYHWQTGRFNTYTTGRGLTSNHIRRLKQDMRGHLWISFDTSYVNRLADGTFTPFGPAEGLHGKKINAIIEDQKGRLLFGSREDGVFAYRDGTFVPYPIPGLENPIINTMYEDRQGDLWIGTSQGLFRKSGQDTVRYTGIHGLSHDAISVIMEDSRQNLWLGTRQGLNRLRENQDSAAFESLLTSLFVTCLFEDDEQGLWLGTYDSGLKRLKDRKFVSCAPLDAFQEEIFYSLFQDRQGDIWVGTASGRLFRCSPDGRIESVEFPQLAGVGIAAIADDADGNLWLGTTGKGVFQQKGGRLVQFTSRHGLADNLVTAIFRDSRGHLWFSTFDGVSVLRCPGNTIESLHASDGLSGKRVHNVYEDSSRHIWVAADNGLTLLKHGQMAARDIDHLLPDISVTCVYEDPPARQGKDDRETILWAATNGAGLIRLHLKQGTAASATSFTTGQGMASNFIGYFFEDPQANFWLMSSRGVLQVSKSQLNQFAHDKKGIINCISYGTADGLESAEFNDRFSRHSILKARSGELWFVTRKGISIVNPDKIRLHKSPPPVVIEAFLVDRRDVRFRFTAPTFLSPQKVRFKYRLDSLDSEWNYLNPGKERTLHYPDLSPGTYTFRLSAANADGVWNPSGASRTFTLKPHFYQTVPFKIAVILLLALSLTGAGTYSFKRLKKKLRPPSSRLNPHHAEECIRRLNHLMQVDNVCCDADLSLQSLAERLSIHPHQLSWLLNKRLKRSFSDYINHHRIEAAKKILTSPGEAEKKITTLAHDVGFNTMTAFYNAFKKHTTMTPNHYRQKFRQKS